MSPPYLWSEVVGDALIIFWRGIPIFKKRLRGGPSHLWQLHHRGG